MKRKLFLQQSLLATTSLFASPLLSFAEGKNVADPLPAEKVKEFVGAGHNNFDKVKALVSEMPTLIYASWDLGSGDF